MKYSKINVEKARTEIIAIIYDKFQKINGNRGETNAERKPEKKIDVNNNYYSFEKLRRSEMKRVISFFCAIVLLLQCTGFSVLAKERVKPYMPEEDNLLGTEMESRSVTEPVLYSYNLTWNIESINYYVDSSASVFTTQIANAAHNWVYTGYGYNRLYPFTETTNIKLSAADFHGYNNYLDGKNGETIFWNRYSFGGAQYEVNPNEYDWLFCDVNLNRYFMDNMTSDNKKGVIAHEMGHVFGIGHNNLNSYSIMCQENWGRAVSTVQKVDADAFIKKHPN
ncbi:hypothetical protein [uncultured Neglectibacter sp.]|uniref:hypothetical protein n=1 Tax=uncultured Neglectibacter sp. TaxID=1924108 RepID=UPI0034DE1B83